MRKFITLLITSVSLLQICAAQSKNAPDKPKLVVGIVVDQMRYDFIWKFWNLYGDGGFKRLVSDGYLCRNTHYNYMLTTTAPGHASIYTGTTPAMHGIIENGWFDRGSGSEVYVMTDPKSNTVGNAVSSASASPFRLLTTTITDELKMASRNSKVIGIAIKDRASILPAGHSPDGAFWFDSKTGNWISSTWYMKQLPSWLEQFNASSKRDNYMTTDWKLLLPRKAYTMCSNDTVIHESPWKDELLPVFPHKMIKGRYDLISNSPFGNTMTKDIAIEAIKAEQLGKHAETDFLCISFSSTDMIGHAFGPNSLETADCYARLDRDLEALLNFLDEYVGRHNTLIFLSADHGVAINPLLANDEHLSGSFMETDTLIVKANRFLSSTFGAGNWIEGGSSQQLYLNYSLISKSKLSKEAVSAKTIDFLSTQPGILCVNAPGYGYSNCAPYIQQSMMNGYYPARSGDILYSLEPGWVEWHSTKGTSHGTVFAYDQHVPLIWYGWKIAHGTTVDPIAISDIAPTISNWLNIPFPSGCTGQPIIGIPLKQ